MPYTFYNEDYLLDRLKYCSSLLHKNVIFLVGSALVAPSVESPYGIPNVDGVIDIIKGEFKSDPKESDSFQSVLIHDKSKNYMEAFKYLLGTRGQEVANSVVRKVVWKALNLEKLPKELAAIAPANATNEHCSTLEESSENWHLPIAADALGSIIVNCPCFAKAVLTTNFDPLIEMGIKRNGGNYFRTVLAQDGNLHQTHAPGCHVVHLHGYWSGYDTLHTSQQLLQPRRRLKSSLTSLLANSTVVILGYGGWDDIFTNTLMEVVSDGMTKLDIVWAFYEKDASIEGKYSQLLTALESGINSGRVALYQGIDCNLFLPKLKEAINVTPASQNTKALHAEQPATLNISRTIESDNPPVVDDWVGREHELNLISNTSARVVFITGIGGQGKSALVSQSLAGALISHPELFWDWRDCKEEGDRLQTQVTFLLERVSGGQFTASPPIDMNFEEIIEILFIYLKKKDCLLIFDNIDHYVDLEAMQPSAGMALLVNAAITKSHKSKFIFTCRPNIRYENEAVLTLNLQEGLTFENTKELFKKKHVTSSNAEIEEAHLLTQGHPLWLNLLAMQVLRSTIQLSTLVAQVKDGTGDLPENTLRSIWGNISDNQKTLLRTMAEMVRPDTEERLYDFLKDDIKYNKFSKALKALKEFNLIVIKSRANSENLLDLHPLIRTFIRTRYRKEERKEYATIILRFLDGMILKFKEALNKNPSHSILENWTQKTELSINCGNHEEAIETLSEIAGPLLARGLPEEFARLARKLLAEVDWSIASATYKGFDNLFAKYIEVLSWLGGTVDVDLSLNKYNDSIPGKGAQYINYCNLKCYSLWLRGDFDQATYWGSEGARLKKDTNVDTRFDCEHNLALAQRDNGDFDVALKYFLRGKTLDEVLGQNKIESELGEDFYGNIGRCLYLKAEYENALICYKKSALIIEKKMGGISNSMLNRGYARLWLAEAFERTENWDAAFAFYATAYESWRYIMPLKAQEISLKLDIIRKHIVQKPLYEYERFCKQWITSSDQPLADRKESEK